LKLKVEFNFKGARQDMIVCICNRVCDRKIKETIQAGAQTVEAVGRACHAGTGCGACQEEIQDMIDTASAAPRCDASRLKVLSPYLMPGKAA
jgi:bacterioferritin-associated ferredoxin